MSDEKEIKFCKVQSCYNHVFDAGCLICKSCFQDRYNNYITRNVDGTAFNWCSVCGGYSMYDGTTCYYYCKKIK